MKRGRARALAWFAVAGIVATALPSPNARAASWTDLAVADDHACAVRDDGTLWCFDRASPLRPTAAAAEPEIVPGQVGTATDWAAVTAGAGFTCGLKADGSLWCWGFNNRGQLGMNLGPVKALPLPLQSGGRRDWKLVKAGELHVCGLHADGTLDCRGEVRPDPDDMRFRAVGAGYNSTCAIRDDGTLWCWGDICRREGFSGPLTCWGGAAEGSTSRPGQIGRETDWIDVSVGFGYACGIRNDGGLWCWGEGGAGAFGNLGKGFRPHPTRIEGGPWSRVAVDTSGGMQTCALRPDHSLWCWGQAGAGYLGGAPSVTGDAVEVSPHGQWSKVAVNRRRTCAIRLDGSLWCWGEGLGVSGGNAPPPGIRVSVEPRSQELDGSGAPLGADWRPSSRRESPARREGRKIVTVDGAQGLLAALGSHRTIVLLPGEYSLPHAAGRAGPKDGRRPGARPAGAAVASPYFAAGAIQDLTDLAIVSAEPGAAVFTSRHRDAPVLAFARVAGLRLEGLRIEGPPADWGGGGIVLRDCRDVKVVDSVVSGGWLGVHATRTDGLEFERTTVRFVEGEFMALTRSRRVVVRSSLFTASVMFNFGFRLEWSDLLLDGSAIRNNGRMTRTDQRLPIFAIDEWTRHGAGYGNDLPIPEPGEPRVEFVNPVMSRVEVRDSRIEKSGDVLAAFHPRGAIARGTTADFGLPAADPPGPEDGGLPASPLWAVVVHPVAGEDDACGLGEAGGPLPAPPQAIQVPLRCSAFASKLRVTLVPWSALDELALSQCEGACDASGKGAWRALKPVAPFTYALRPATAGPVRLLIRARERGAWRPLQEIGFPDAED